MKLYEINEQIDEALEQAIDPETGEILDGWQDVIDELGLAREEKALNIGVAIRQERLDSAIFGDEIKRLQKAKKARDNNIDKMKDYLVANLEPGTKYKDHRVSLYLMHTKSVQVDDINKLDPRFKRITVEPDKTAIKLSIAQGGTVDGACLVDNDSLVVK